MRRPQDIVAEIGQEEEGIVVAILESQLLLGGQTLENLVYQSWNLSRSGAMRAVSFSAIDKGQEQDH
jgi:hypothetical protein